MQGSPVRHHLYHQLPVLVWGVLLYRFLGVIRVAWVMLRSYNMVWEVAIRLLAILLALQILVSVAIRLLAIMLTLQIMVSVLYAFWLYCRNW